MGYQFYSLAFGLLSIFLFQFEQSLRLWLEDFKKDRPYYNGNILSVLVATSEKLKAHKETIKNVLPFICFSRWTAILLGILSLLIGLK